MNEIRDLIIGIDFGKKYSQLCYYDRKADEVRSVSMKVGVEEYEAPTCICRRIDQKDYCAGIEAEYFAKEKGGVLIDHLYELCETEEAVQAGDEQREPWELLAYFLRELLKFSGVSEVVKNTRCLVISLPALSAVQIRNLEKACAFLGFPRGRYLFLDYGETFFYYCLTQKRETWNRSVGWFEFQDSDVIFRKLSMNSSTRPVLVKMEPPVENHLADWADSEKRDADFLEFAEGTMGNDLFSSIILTGEGFDQSWAKKSTAFLCAQRRKVFYGNNLFAKGACAAGKEKFEDKKLKGYHYISDAQVLCDVGMDVRVMGAPTYYPMIEAGKNWYECRSYCEMILDNTRELVFTVSRFGDTEKKKVIMELKGLAKRPNRTTRIALSLEYTAPGKCKITAKDLGFGEMYPSRGKTWEETVEW